MLVVLIHANQSEFKTKFKGTFCIKLSLMQSLFSPVPCPLLNVMSPSGWWQLSNSVVYPSFMPLSTTKAWLSESTDHTLQGEPRNEKENQWLIYTSPISLSFFFNRPTEILWGSMALLSSIPAISNLVVQKLLQYSNFCHWLLWGKHCQLHPSRPFLSKHFLWVSVLTQSLWAALERGSGTSSWRRVLLYSRWCLSKIEDPWSFANGDVDLEGEGYAMILAV